MNENDRELYSLQTMLLRQTNYPQKSFFQNEKSRFSLTADKKRLLSGLHEEVITWFLHNDCSTASPMIVDSHG